MGSVFQYVVKGTAPCPNDTSLATVTINPQATVNAGAPQAICSNSKANLVGTIGGSATSVTWSAPVGTGTFSNANALSTTFTPNITNGTITLTLTTNDPAGPCPAATSTVIITVIPGVDAGLDGSTTICDNSTVPINLFNLITGEQPGGTWKRLVGTDGSLNATTGIYTPSGTATNSVFQYIVFGTAPCPNDTALVTVSISLKPLVNAGPDQTFCENAPSQFKMDASPSAGVWTIVQPANGATITNINDSKTTVTGLQLGKSVTLVWTVSENGCTASDSLNLGKDSAPPFIDVYDKDISLADCFINPRGEALVCVNTFIKSLNKEAAIGVALRFPGVWTCFMSDPLNGDLSVSRSEDTILV